MAILIYLLAAVVVACIVFYAISSLVPDRHVRVILNIAVVVLLLLWLSAVLGLWSPMGTVRLR